MRGAGPPVGIPGSAPRAKPALATPTEVRAGPFMLTERGNGGLCMAERTSLLMNCLAPARAALRNWAYSWARTPMWVCIIL